MLNGNAASDALNVTPLPTPARVRFTTGEPERMLGALMSIFCTDPQAGDEGTVICPRCDGFVRWSCVGRPRSDGVMIAGHCIRTQGCWSFAL